MRSRILSLLLLLLLSSCAQTFYYKQKFVQPQGLDFSSGNWFIGSIEAQGKLQNEMSEIVLSDFSKYAKGEVKSFMNEKTILIAKKIPLNPDKEVMLDLKRTTGSDYYINIKSESRRKDMMNFQSNYQMYYKEKMTYAIVILEVYDLNKHEMIYSQAVIGKCHEEMGINSDFERKVILGCYKTIFKEIKKKYS